MNLTRRQREALDFIESFIREKRYSPTTNQIREGLGLRSQASVQSLMLRLEARGGLHRPADAPRTIELGPRPLTPRYWHDETHGTLEIVWRQGETWPPPMPERAP